MIKMTLTDEIDENYYRNVADYIPVLLPRPTIKIIFFPSGEDP